MKYQVKLLEDVATHKKGDEGILPLQISLMLESKKKVKLLSKPLRNREARELKKELEQQVKAKKEAAKKKRWFFY